MLEQDGNIDMHCDYCGNHYVFDALDIAALHNGNADSSTQLH
jgi:molecular chaperone Hsp33